jgi:tetratricopeptide (TPR) repeat protein
MVPSTELFDLIRSLNKSEKGYFQKFSSFHTRGEQNNYVRLFDAIEKQSASGGEYNEPKLLKLFSGEKLTNNFSVAKAYLYDLILKSLDVFHTDVDSELYGLLHRVKILYDKELYTHCLKLINKTEELALKYEKHIHQLLIVQWKMKLMSAMSYRGFSPESIDFVFTKAVNAIRNIENENDYLAISAQLFIRRKKSGSRVSPEQNQYYDRVNKEKLQGAAITNLEGNALTSFYLSKGLYHYSRDEYKESIAYGKKLISHIEARPALLKDDPQFYISAINNMIVLKIRTKRFTEVKPLVEKMRQFQNTSPRLKNYVLFAASGLEATMYINTGQFKEGLKLMKDMFKTMPRIIQKEQELGLYYNMARIYFGLEDYAMASFYLNKIVNVHTIGDFRNDLYFNIRLINLFIYLETGKLDLVEYRIKSIRRLLKKWQMSYPIEAEILRFMEQRFKNVYSVEDKYELLRELESQIYKVSKSIKVRGDNMNNNFFVSWLESKIQKRSFSKILMAKAKISSVE